MKEHQRDFLPNLTKVAKMAIPDLQQYPLNL